MTQKEALLREIEKIHTTLTLNQEHNVIEFIEIKAKIDKINGCVHKSELGLQKCDEWITNHKEAHQEAKVETAKISGFVSATTSVLTQILTRIWGG